MLHGEMDPLVCACSCHEYPNGIVHMIVCCEECQYCHKNIIQNCMKGHLEECRVYQRQKQKEMKVPTQSS